MIDLSHLTEEEQEVIMTVLSRDAELKRAEDERIRKLENALNSGTQQPDSNLKYFTGEWFYEAKSRRHMDTIHGSEIILASIKRRKSALDGSIRMERSKSPSSQGSDLIPPPKPARTWEALQPQETNPTDKEALQIRSPRTPRHNPFNRASLLVVDPPEETVDVSHGAEQQSPAVTDCSGSRQTPAGSVTSDASSAGFRPVPKKRTFLSRRFSGAQDPETLGRPVGVVPAPRRSLQNSSNGSSHLSTVKPQDTNTETNATSPKQVMEFSQACSRSSLERNTPAPEKNSASSYITRDGEAEDGQVNLTQKPPVTTETVPPLSSNSIHNSEGEIISSVGSASRQELSLTRSSVAAEPSVSYDLNYIDKSDQQMQAKAKQELRLSPQMATPTGEEDDSITKVLDWFNRSSDSSDWLNNSEEKITKSSKDEYLASTEADPDTGKSHVPIEIHQQLKQEENNNENQHAKISYLKSFWEKSNAGPKVLISKSITSNDKESKTSKDEERCDTQSTTSIHNNMGVHQEDTDKLPDANCKYSDVSESIYITRANSSHQKETNSELQSLTGPEIHLVKTAPASLFAPNKQTNGISLLVEDLQFEEINKREKRIPEFQVQVKDNLESDQLVHLKPNKQISPKIQAHSSNEDMKRRKHRDRSPKSAPIKDRSPVFNRHVSTQDVPLKDKERIKHLKSFWEQERAKTGYIVKTRADLKSTSGKLNKKTCQV
ncbi:synaptotagmin-like protein 2 [Boleophthalmus pectinirostris]|uniref:synaptotagmin-like protein 2 n=1 Tax=Boleophthalmus pectinirostris TaxID=150288 RepID=UPI0024329C52|nr:synaptotagmin-like protein 2 [Boleophthalmus pectinirostris]